MKEISRKQAAAVTTFGSDVDYQREELYLVFGHGKAMGPIILLDYEKLQMLEDHLRRVRQTFDHGRQIRAERAKRYVDPNSISTVE